MQSGPMRTTQRPPGLRTSQIGLRQTGAGSQGPLQSGANANLAGTSLRRSLAGLGVQSQQGGACLLYTSDLYYRLKVIELAMPSLRERSGDDVERLAQHFVKLYATKHNKAVRGISPEAMRRLRDHRWPGNIRELEHCVESAVALCPGAELTSADLPLPHSSHSTPRTISERSLSLIHI